VIIHPVIEYLSDVICDVITLYVHFQTTSIP
jgi:hypothetical protein